MSNTVPLISVVIVNWNGESIIQKCIRSVLDQEYPSLEIIVVDNASTDGSAAMITHQFPSIRLVRNTSNVGFATGSNQGVNQATGEYILFLNTDAWLGKDFFPPLVQEFQRDPKLAAAGPLLLRANDPTLLDTCGSYWTLYTWLYHFGYGKEASRKIYHTPRDFFAIKGAVFIVRKDAFDRVGSFDNDFWCYYEETDLCHRFWIAGYKCRYLPVSTAYHEGGVTSKKFFHARIQFHNFKNQLQSFLKNFSFRSLLWILPVHILFMIGISIVWIIRGKVSIAISPYAAIAWTCYNIRPIVNKRKMVQTTRELADTAFLPYVTKNPSPFFFIHELSSFI